MLLGRGSLRIAFGSSMLYLIVSCSEVEVVPPKTSIQQVVDELMAYEPKKIILFGSAARGDDDEYSDIDLIIVKETDTRFVRRAVEAGFFLSPSASVDLFVYTPAELEAMIEEGNPFIEEALRDGKVVYEEAR